MNGSARKTALKSSAMERATAKRFGPIFRRCFGLAQRVELTPLPTNPGDRRASIFPHERFDPLVREGSSGAARRQRKLASGFTFYFVRARVCGVADKREA